MRHILAVFAITPRSGLHQHAVFIAQTHSEAVKFQLGHVLHGRCDLKQFQLFADAGIKCLGTGRFGIGLGAYAQHGYDMAHAIKLRQRLAAHTLRGRIHSA